MAVVSRVEIALDATKAIGNAKKFERAMDGVAGATRDANGRLRDANGKFIGAGKAAAAAGAGTKAAVPGVRALGLAFKAALGPIAIFTTAAGAATAAFSILSKQDFGEAKVRSLGVDSEELTKRLSDVSRELAGQADVVELTGAAYDVASAGFTNAADAANILKAASLGATGGFSDINTVGDAATSVLNAYGLEADKAGKLVDGFIQTQNDGKIVIGEYAANIAKVAPVAAALGVPLEEVNAAVAQITAGGQGAEVTFTALKTAFAQIAAGKVGKEFEGLGIEINASTLKADGLAGTLKKIKKSGADAGTVIKAFGTEAGPSILALLNNTEKYNQLLENQKQSQGAAAKAAFEASDTINGALKRLQTAFTNIFADQSELGILLKGTFQVAAVTVEILGVSIKSLLAPIRGIAMAASEFFNALSPFEDNITLAMALEDGFQRIMKAANFATAVVAGFFKSTAGLAYNALLAVVNFGKGIASQVVQAFAGLGEVIHEKLTNIYKALPEPLKTLIDMAVGAAKAVGSFVSNTASNVVNATGKGVNALAKAGGFRQDQPSDGTSPAANAIQQTNRPSASQAGEAEKLLNTQLKSGAELSKQFQRQIKLKEANTDLLRQELQIEFERQDALAKIAETAELGQQADLNALANKIALLDTEKARTENADRLAKIQAKADKDAADAAKRRLEADPSYQMQQQLEKLVDTQNQAAFAAQSMGNAFANAFVDVVSGTKSVQQAAADMLKSIASDFLAMAKKIIAQQLIMILYQTILKALGGGGGVGFNPNAPSITGNSLGDFGGGTALFAEGGYVTGPTNAVVGEGGEPEYVIPESKMRESMGRYSRGSRGSSVIPAEGGGAAGTEDGTITASAIDVRFKVERINSVDYVTATEFQQGMQQAAKEGAQRGEQQAIKRLQMSSGTRKRIGL